MTQFYSEDQVFECYICGTKLRFASTLKSCVEVDPSNHDHILNKEHTCYPNIEKTKRKKSDDMGISSMQRERLAQEEYYGKFESSSQLSTNTTQTLKSIREKQQQPRTEEHSKNIAAALQAKYHSKLETRHNNIIRFLESGMNKNEIATRLNVSYFVIVQDILQLKARGQIL
jgi:hypothetical protein